MTKQFIIGNWKSNKTVEEALSWLDQVGELSATSQKEIIIAPSYTLLCAMSSYISEQAIPIKLCAQDISPFSEGAYTGEVNGNQIGEFAQYVLIGHSERREHLGESEDLIERKITMAKMASLTPILCVRDEKDSVPREAQIVVYEPTFAIGTGHPDTPENAQKFCSTLKKAYPHITHVLYGGSVTSQNVSSFINTAGIDGVLPGKASLDGKEFQQIIKNA